MSDGALQVWEVFEQGDPDALGNYRILASGGPRPRYRAQWVNPDGSVELSGDVKPSAEAAHKSMCRVLRRWIRL